MALWWNIERFTMFQHLIKYVKVPRIEQIFRLEADFPKTLISFLIGVVCAKSDLVRFWGLHRKEDCVNARLCSGLFR